MLNRVLHFGPHKLTFWPLANPMLTQCFQPMHAACYVPQNILEALKQAHSILLSRWQTSSNTILCSICTEPTYVQTDKRTVWNIYTAAMTAVLKLVPGKLRHFGIKAHNSRGETWLPTPRPLPRPQSPEKAHFRKGTYSTRVPVTVLQDEALMIS